VETIKLCDEKILAAFFLLLFAQNNVLIFVQFKVFATVFTYDIIYYVFLSVSP